MDGFSVSNRNSVVGTSEFGELRSSSTRSGSSSTEANGPSFADTLKQAVNEVNELQKVADKGMQDLATGRTDNIPDVMIAAEKADIALRLMVQVRNKIIDAYQEVMKMQV